MLPKENRLTARYDYNKTRFIAKKNNTRYFGQIFNLFFYQLHDSDAPTKVGIIVSNKVHKSAVKRNRIKRLIREVVREHFDKIEKGYHIVIHANNESLGKSYEEIGTEYTKVLQNLFISR